MTHPTSEETARALIVLNEDMNLLQETVDRILAQFDALNVRHGVVLSPASGQPQATCSAT